MTERTPESAEDVQEESETKSDNRRDNESMDSFIERRIQEAEAEGAFARLPGFGKPIPGIDQPQDENWWLREKLKREQVNALPPILQAKLEVEKMLATLAGFKTEYQLRKRLEQLNEQIREAHYSPNPGPAVGIFPLDIEQVIADWKALRGG